MKNRSKDSRRNWLRDKERSKRKGLGDKLRKERRLIAILTKVKPSNPISCKIEVLKDMMKSTKVVHRIWISRMKVANNPTI